MCPGTVLGARDTVVKKCQNFQSLHTLEGVRYKDAVGHVIMADMEIPKDGRIGTMCSGLHFK